MEEGTDLALLHSFLQTVDCVSFPEEVSDLHSHAEYFVDHSCFSEIVNQVLPDFIVPNAFSDDNARKLAVRLGSELRLDEFLIYIIFLDNFDFESFQPVLGTAHFNPYGCQLSSPHYN